MNIKLSNVLMFVAGAAIGSLATWKLLKTKYEQRAQEEIDSVKETYGIMYDEGEDAEAAEEPADTEDAESHAIDDMRKAYNDIAQNAGYNTIAKEDSAMAGEKQYIISPEEFDTLDGYTVESLYCYADGVLTDVDDEIIDFPEHIIGDIKPLEHFGEYEDDSVYIRNDVTKCDYEILRDTRTYHGSEED